MSDKTKAQLVAENEALRQRVKELERAETRLRESEERFRHLFQDSAAGTVLVTPDGSLVHANKAFCDFLGYGEAELLGQTIESITHPEDQELSSRVLHQAFTSGPRIHRIEKRYLHKNGQILWGEVTSTLICDAEGQPSHYLAQVLDITKRKRAEAALQEARDELERRVEQRTAELTKANEELAIFRKFAESSSQGFGISDLEGRLVYANSALSRMCGEDTPEDMIGKYTTDYYAEEWRERRMTEVLPSLERAGRWQGEMPVLTRQGKRTPALHHVFLLPDEEGISVRRAVVVTDISERKQAEEALRQSERRFRNYFDQGLIGMAVTSVDRRWLEVNDRLCEILGHSREELLQSNWAELTHPDDIEPNVHLFNRLLAGQIEHYTLDKRFFRKDRSIVYTTIHIRAFRKDDGSIDHIVALTEDITARKQAEEALRQNHDQLQTIYDGIVEGLIITDIETKRIRRVNSSFCRMLGFGREELLTKSIAELHPPEEVANDFRRFQAAADGRVSINEDRPVLRKDGGVFYADITGHRILYEERPCLLALFRDVTERRQWAEALRTSEERYRTVVEDQTEVISRFKADGAFTFVNEVFCRFFGKTSQELLESKWPLATLPDDVPIVQERLRALSPGNPIVVVENRVHSGLGQVRWMQFVNRGFFDQEGRLTEVQSVGRDITERKQAQEALEQERQSLWRMLQASDHERQIISYEIHDGLAQYLAAATMQFQSHDALRAHFPHKAKKAYETALELVRQSHFESRRLISAVRPPVIDEIGLETAISHLVHEQRRRGGPKIKFDSEVQFGRLPPILENALYRIVQEALTNACNHSRSKQVTVAMTQEGQDVRLEVRDSGIGFDLQAVEEGHFGLEGIRQRVRLLGGRFTLQSAPGAGTLVQVVVPILERQNDV